MVLLQLRLLFEILNDNNLIYYDFENLFIKIERKNKTVEPIGVIKKKKINKNKLSKSCFTSVLTFNAFK